MRRHALFALAAAGLLGAAPAPAASSAAGVYARMQRVNADLRSYTATLHVDVTTHGFPYISPSLDGTAYYKRPDKSAVVFNTVPAIADAFKNIKFQLEPPAEWDRLYDVTPTGDDGTTARFRLVRKKSGRIDHVDVTADDATATVRGMTYVYRDGGSVTFEQKVERMGNDYVVQSQTGKIDLPRYNADVSSSFSNYKLNVTVPDTVFGS